MRYWVYEDDRLAGPFSPEELKDRPRFEEGTLVIAEERLDPGAGRWRRAADVPGLALALSEKSRKAFVGSLRPPEPAVRDLSILGSLLEQVERIEGVLVGMRNELRNYQAEAEKLWEDGKVREARATVLDENNAKLSERMKALEALQTDVAALRTELAAAQESRAGLDSRLTGALGRLAEASTNLDAARAAQAALASELVEVRTADAGLRAELEATRAETAALREHAEARARADAEKAAAAVAALDEREGSRWLWGSLHLSPSALAKLALAAGVLAAAALALGIRAELRARKPLVAAVPMAPEPTPVPAPHPPAAPQKAPAAEPPPAPEPSVMAPSEPEPAPAPIPRVRKPRPAPAPSEAAKAEALRLKVLAAATVRPQPAQDEPEPQALALAFLAPSPAPGMCPRGLDELVAGDGGPVRTPQEALECWTWTRVGAEADALAKARKVSRDEALADLQVDAMGWGGFGKLFPLEVKAEKTEGRAYRVVLTRRDLLAEKLAVRYKLKKLAGAESSLSYEVDVAERSLRPLDAASWRVLDAQASSSPLPAPAYKR